MDYIRVIGEVTQLGGRERPVLAYLIGIKPVTGNEMFFKRNWNLN